MAKLSIIIYNSQKQQSQQKPGALLVALLLLALAAPPAFSAGAFRVDFVCDGDTVILESGETVRYIGIDAPEMGDEEVPPEFLARESRDFNRSLVAGRPIRLEFDQERRDRYGRLLAYLYPEDGGMVNLLLVRRGLARVLVTPPNTARARSLLEAQRRAMRAGVGLWGRPAESGGGPYVGSRRSYRFHRPGCPYGMRIRERNRIKFESRRDAFWEGFSPCRKCMP